MAGASPIIVRPHTRLLANQRSDSAIALALLHAYHGSQSYN